MTTPLPELRLLRDSFADRPAFGTAVSEAILQARRRGRARPHAAPAPARAASSRSPSRTPSSPGFAAAVAAGRAAGFEPVLRLAGGRAAAFHEGTIALSMATPGRPGRRGHARSLRADRNRDRQLRCASLGVDARVGEVPGEYCPGAWSVNAGGSAKLVGIGQRLISGGAHVGGVIVVDGAEPLRDLLVPVYDALELEWDPATVGSVADEVGPTALDTVEDAILAELAKALAAGARRARPRGARARRASSKPGRIARMRILAFSDLHCDLAGAARLVEASEDVDLVIGAGDFASVHSGLERDDRRAAARSTTPTLLVPGNNEREDDLRAACAGWDAATVLHGEGTEVDGVSFWGLGAGHPDHPVGLELRPRRAGGGGDARRASEDGMVLIVHSPPFGHVDTSSTGHHLGSRAILSAIEARAAGSSPSAGTSTRAGAGVAGRARPRSSTSGLAASS